MGATTYGDVCADLATLGIALAEDELASVAEGLDMGIAARRPPAAGIADGSWGNPREDCAAPRRAASA